MRHAWHLSVQESIEVNVSTKPSYHSKMSQEFNLSVTVHNMNRLHHAVVIELTVLNVGLLSTNWILLNSFIAPSGVKLYAQESTTMLLKCQRRRNKDNSYSVVSLQHSDGLNNINSTYLDIAKRWGQNKTNIFEDEADNIERIVNKLESMLLLRWRADVTDSKGIKSRAFGQNILQIPIAEMNDNSCSHIGSVIFYDNKQDDNYYKTQKMEYKNGISLENQIRYNIVHSPCIQHNFKLKKLCIIPVKLILYSMVDTNIAVTVRTLHENR